VHLTDQFLHGQAFEADMIFFNENEHLADRAAVRTVGGVFAGGSLSVA
jgi:hypothetical protein